LCNFICKILIAPSSSSPCCPKELHVNCIGSWVPMSLSFAVIVFLEWRRTCTTRCPSRPRGLGSSERAQSRWFSPRRVATLETCQLVCHSATRLAWKQCGEVTLHGLRTKYIWILALHYCKKKDTGVSSRYSYKLFLYLLFYTRKQTCFNLTMLFNVSHLSFSFLFFMAFGHASNNPFQFQVVYFCFPIKFTIYPDFWRIVFSQLLWWLLKCNDAPFLLRMYVSEMPCFVLHTNHMKDVYHLTKVIL